MSLRDRLYRLFAGEAKANAKGLVEALRAHRGGATLLMDERDTSFAGYTEDDVEEDARTLNAIRSVPTHYAGINSITGSSISTEFK